MSGRSSNFTENHSQIAIQQFNVVEKNSVAVSLMLNHNLTGLYRNETLKVSVNLRKALPWNSRNVTFRALHIQYVAGRKLNR